MRFNPPPNWPPIPQGWTPPPGWQPDPSWPPPPPGWELWTPDEKPRRNVGLIVGGLAAVLLVAVGVVVAVVAAQRSPQTPDAQPNASPSPSASQGTDQQQIDAVAQKFAKAWNDKDFAAFESIVCEKMRNNEAFNEKDFLKARSIRTEMDVTVTAVKVKGDKAVATIQQPNLNPDQIDFAREDGEWKWCEL